MSSLHFVISLQTPSLFIHSEESGLLVVSFLHKSLSALLCKSRQFDFSSHFPLLSTQTWTSGLVGVNLTHKSLVARALTSKQFEVSLHLSSSLTQAIFEVSSIKRFLHNSSVAPFVTRLHLLVSTQAVPDNMQALFSPVTVECNFEQKISSAFEVFSEHEISKHPSSSLGTQYLLLSVVKLLQSVSPKLLPSFWVHSLHLYWKNKIKKRKQIIILFIIYLFKKELFYIKY